MKPHTPISANKGGRKQLSTGKNLTPKSASQMKHPARDIDSSPIRKYTDSGQKLIVNAMRSVLALPAGNSRDLYASHPSFVRIMDSHANKILHAIGDVLKMHDVKGNIVLRDREEKFELLQEFNDTILERINSNLDEVAGIKKKHETVLVSSEIQIPTEPRHRLSGNWNENNRERSNATASSPAVKATLITATNIVRPQVNFKVPVDNSQLNPFVPKIKYKPNSLKPLAVLPEYDDLGNIASYLHPYEFELDKFQPSKEDMKLKDPQKPILLEDTPLDFIDKENQLPALMEELRQAKELALDLEHHSYRSFQGFTCLMQISTRKKDYILDALALREELHVLNEVFTDSKIIKVLHGSVSDIEWLQRDLALYVVNMFDTAEAAKILEFSRIGLQFLLKHYCDIETDKTYQLADWRIRPVPENFIDYARKDTHYLLYIYDCMRNELIQKGPALLQTVYNKATFLCKQRYVKPIINEDTIMSVYRRSKHVFDQRQMYAFREILYWRDKMARQEDESPGYVLPQHMALDIASKLPREMQGIIACCTPVPSLVRQHLHTLHQIILKAREIPLNKSVPVAIEQQKDTRHKMQSTFDINNPLFCPHDASHLHHSSESGMETNLPTLLDAPEKVGSCQRIVKKLLKEQPEANVFAESKIRTLDDKGRLILDDSASDDGRMVNFIEMHYLKHPDSNQNLNTSLHLSYQDRKFNTPYERHLETCRNRQDEPEHSEKIIEEKTINITSLKEESEVKEESSNKPKKQKALPLKVQKRREDREMKRAILPETDEPAAKLCFSSYEPPPKKERRSKGEYPLQLKPLPEPKNENDFADGDSDTEIRGANESSQMTKSKNKKKKKNKRGKPIANSRDSQQSSNKPVNFDYKKVDFSRFQGGSRPLEHKKGRGGGKFVMRRPSREDAEAGEGSSNGNPKKNIHPNSRIAKGIQKTQKMFNFSSNNLKRK
ncbi:exosome component 10-like [Uranotaenia lowii]|uniref:exosome component 10-like n=1 Tax=Uranotaenia lowii TaxID=190385 RepID=UPI002479E6E9|nr:exosome component 10-like [Uranotaenia lowii]